MASADPIELLKPGRDDGFPAEALLSAQGKIIDAMADGAALTETLTSIALLVEALAPPALCSILLLQPDGKHLKPAAAPSLPEAFCAAVDGLEIGPKVGSCGTATWRKEAVIVTDIATDPLWEAARDFTLSFGLRACWSLPIMRGDGTVLGTIAMYYREPRAPAHRDWGLLAPCARLVRLALAEARKEDDLRATEAHWLLAAEASGLGTYDLDFITGTDRWSAQFKAILGLPETAIPSETLFVEIIHPDDRKRFEDAFRPLPDMNASTVQDEDLRILRADTGEERIVKIKGRVLFAADGTPVRGIGTLADITRHRRHEMDLAEAKAAAEAASRAKSRFLASMSHELRTPLNAIIGYSDVIRQQVFGAISPSRYEDYANDIHKSGQHLLSLINDVLDMAKIEAGKFELNPAPLYLAQVAEHALLFVAPQAKEKGLQMRATIAPELSLTADERAIRQILTNLLSNAVKFTPPGGTVRVFADRMEDGGLALGVEDTGKGMTPANIKVALEPFGQAHDDATIEGPGTGLGLPIVKSLIEAHGAVFRIESEPGKGTRVWGEFPARDVTTNRGAA